MKKFILIILFLFSALCLATNEIWYDGDSYGQDRYCRIITVPAQTIWDGDSWEASPASWAVTAIALTENTTIKGYYYCTFPDSTAGDYIIKVYSGAAGSAADTDAVVTGFEFDWSGTAEITNYTLTQGIKAVDSNGTGLATWQQANEIKAKTDNLNFTGNDVKATLDGETVDVNDRTGFGLATDGLDSISTTEPNGVAENFREMLVQTWQRFFVKTTASATYIKTYKNSDPNIANTKQAISIVSGLTTIGSAEPNDPNQ